MQPPITPDEWGLAWMIWRELNNHPEKCAPSCGCKDDPIVIIVEAVRKWEKGKEATDATDT